MNNVRDALLATFILTAMVFAGIYGQRYLEKATSFPLTNEQVIQGAEHCTRNGLSFRAKTDMRRRIISYTCASEGI